MDDAPIPILEQFSQLDDPRVDRTKRHSMDCVSAVSELTKGEVITIGGEAVRRSADKANGKSAPHLVSAWSSANRLIFGQRKVDGRSNEITAIPESMRNLDVSGCIVPMDALGCRKKVASEIVEQGADYALALKKNHRELYDDVKDTFLQWDRSVGDFFEQVEKSHGRIGCRSVTDSEWIDHLNGKGEWSALSGVAMVECERVAKEGGIVGITRTDWSASLFVPPCPAAERFIELFEHGFTTQGATMFGGKDLPRMLQEAGLKVEELLITFSNAYMPEPGNPMVAGWAQWIENLPLFDRVIEEGLTTRDAMCAEMREWAAQPGTLAATGGCRAVARKG